MNIQEEGRLKELYTYQLLNTELEVAFNSVVHLAAQICQTPISLITLIDENRQWFKANFGLGTSETLRKHAFCSYAIENKDILEVQNAEKDSRFSTNPLVLGDPYIRFYAGMPLITPNGFKLGTLCVIDREPRKLTEEQKLTLKVLSEQIVQQIELRLKNYQSDFVLLKAEELGKLAVVDVDLRYENWNISGTQKKIFGINDKKNINKDDLISLIHPDHSSTVIHSIKTALDPIEARIRYDQKFKVIKEDSGEEILVKVSLEIIRDEEGKPIKLVGVIKDISELLFREEILLKEINELRQNQGTH